LFAPIPPNSVSNGASILREAAICVHCGIAQPGAERHGESLYVHSAPKNSGVAAVLSFFWPGLGQVYNGDIGKGVFLILLCIVLAFIPIIGWLVILMLWVLAMCDAYSRAESINHQAR
jgi:TM2 domain-containing membrane protein YozV